MTVNSKKPELDSSIAHLYMRAFLAKSKSHLLSLERVLFSVLSHRPLRFLVQDAYFLVYHNLHPLLPLLLLYNKLFLYQSSPSLIFISRLNHPLS